MPKGNKVMSAVQLLNLMFFKYKFKPANFQEKRISVMLSDETNYKMKHGLSIKNMSFPWKRENFGNILSFQTKNSS